jgi:2-isopropylmalate synthase
MDGAAGGHAVTVVELTREAAAPLVLVATGETALEAGFRAVRQAAGGAAEIDSVEILQAGFGAGASARAEVSLRVDDRLFTGRGRGPDPLWAGVRAVVDAFNKAARAHTPAAATTELLEARYEAAG